jgi:hypothetical protein
MTNDKQQWIKIEQGDLSTLPKENEEVLCLSEEGFISVEQRRKAQHYIYCEKTDSGFAVYWMPLPETPKI